MSDLPSTTDGATSAELSRFGWNQHFADAYAPFQKQAYDVGRVAIEHRDGYLLFTPQGETEAEAAGRLRYTAETKADLPKVGDWVVITRFDEASTAVVHHVLPRQSRLSRKVAGRQTREQIIAANIDVIFIVQSMNDNFNTRRLQRSLVMVYDSGARPVIVLNKADLSTAPADYLAKAEQISAGEPVLATSAKTGGGLEHLRQYIEKGKTCAFIGSSGVGKSTIINCLMDEEVLKTTSIRDKDAKGRHTTARRELMVLPDGGLVIDTPGMRELALWETGDGLHDTYADISAMGEACHFSDCTHRHEIRCNILAAVQAGEITRERYESFLKLQQELGELDEKRQQQQLQEKKRSDKILHREIKRFYKNNPKRKR